MLCLPLAADLPEATLPAGVRAVWDLTKAEREVTSTRERVCLNGLWRWQPAELKATEVPTTNWGFYKVPGPWPGRGDYLQKDCQTLYAAPSWRAQRLGDVTAAWYQREISVPAGWAGRRLTVRLDHLNSYSVVYVDSARVGEVHFPGGELDVTSACRPGGAYTLSLLVVAMPLKGVMLSYTDSASAREVKGTVARRGLCGDAFLVSTPVGARVEEPRIDTSVRQRRCTFNTGLEGLVPGATYSLQARISKDAHLVKEFKSPRFTDKDLTEGRFAWSAPWMAPRLWDLHTPQNTFELQLTLLDAAGRTVDVGWTGRFGFREFWIEGRDFYLNGTRLFLSAVPLDNAEVSAATATYAAARESLERLKGIGINFVYTHNYGCEPGSHLGFEEILRAADDLGMLVSLSQPHFSHYDWQALGADADNGYARHARYYVGVARNHPCVVMYSMSHNGTGYSEDMNPEMIDGLRDDRDTWARKNAALALRAEAIVRHLDPSRIVYHHASGNLGSMHDSNFYPNFVPIQELDDWFEHWATQGVKPAFTCEYGAPFTWDWTMYRGWYKGQREFGSAAVPWEFCVAEWNAQFFGDRAYQISEAEKTNLRWEAKQFRAGRVWHRWDYPVEVGSSRFDERYPVFARYLTDNWRAFRTWGVSGISPWEHEHFWKAREGVDRRRRELPTDWEHLQRAGFSPDYLDRPYERMDLAFERSDWVATPAALALLRNNLPLLAYIAGKPSHFTSKDHNCLPGETIEKQIVIINNSRETVNCQCRWSLELPQPRSGRQRVTVAAGQQTRIPLRFSLPADLAPGTYALRASFDFGGGVLQDDTFTIDILPPLASIKVAGKMALFDPAGETAARLRALGVAAEPADANADLSHYDVLIVGKAALTPAGPAPDIGRVRTGLKVLMFEQTAAVLEQRFGFRVEEYGLREVYPRVPDHPVLAQIPARGLHDWRGEATLVPPRLTYEMRPRYGPTIRWCGLAVTRPWRCGNWGNVASVLIEKPGRGDFLPILDGGYGLQYSPLLEYREGAGMVLFCQVDVTSRTDSDPAADWLLRNLVRYVASWAPLPRRQALYAGRAEGKSFLEQAGVSGTYTGGPLSPEDVLVLGAGAAPAASGQRNIIAQFLRGGGHLLAIGLDQKEVEFWLPLAVTMKRAEHIASFFEAMPLNSPFAGTGPADVHNRDPRDLPLVSGEARVVGDGVLASAADGKVVFCQLAPWQFPVNSQMNLKRTGRHVAFLVSRLLGNLGVAAATPVIERFHQPLDPSAGEQRWARGLYVDQPEEWDDPYRFFRW